jgi:hypothetical protein
MVCLSAGVAQLVEHKLPKLGVEGSNPFSRSVFMERGRPNPRSVFMARAPQTRARCLWRGRPKPALGVY